MSVDWPRFGSGEWRTSRKQLPAAPPPPGPTAQRPPPPTPQPPPPPRQTHTPPEAPPLDVQEGEWRAKPSLREPSAAHKRKRRTARSRPAAAPTVIEDWPDDMEIQPPALDEEYARAQEKLAAAGPSRIRLEAAPGGRKEPGNWIAPNEAQRPFLEFLEGTPPRVINGAFMLLKTKQVLLHDSAIEALQARLGSLWATLRRMDTMKAAGLERILLASEVSGFAPLEPFNV